MFLTILNTLSMAAFLCLAVAVLCISASCLWDRVHEHKHKKEREKRQRKFEQEAKEEHERHQSAPCICVHRGEWTIYTFDDGKAFVYQGQDPETQKHMRHLDLVGVDMHDACENAKRAIDEYIHKQEIEGFIYRPWCDYKEDHPEFLRDVLNAVLARPSHFNSDDISEAIDPDTLARIIHGACLESPELFEELKTEFADHLNKATGKKGLNGK